MPCDWYDVVGHLEHHVFCSKKYKLTKLFCKTNQVVRMKKIDIKWKYVL